MDISLISRSFQSHKQGIGNYSKMLYSSIKHDERFNIKLISQDNSLIQRDSPFDYLFFSLIEIPFKLKKADMYHALSPLESFYINHKKSVVTVHDLIPIKMVENNFQSKFLKILFEKAIKKTVKCEKVIAVSKETAKDLSANYNINYEDINVIRPGISSKFTPKSIEEDNFTIGTISHLNSRKRVDILIKSFLETNIENSKLLIGGKGPELEKLKKLSKDDDRIKFIGFVPDEKMNDFYNLLDVFVFPTFMEGYGLPIVEAMACGKPVITLEDGYIPDDVKNRTFISSISKLSNDLEKMNFNCDIKSNLKFAQEHLPEKTGKQIIEIYENMI